MAAQDAADWGESLGDKVALRQAGRVTLLVAGFFVVLGAWAYVAALDEVSSGQGRVVPTTREQIIQSLEGGILTQLNVRQDDIVEPGQVLAQLDPTLTEATFGEAAAKYRAALASASRLDAEVNQTTLKFPAELDAFAELKATETALYQSRQASLNESIALIDESLTIIEKELEISQGLGKIGAASRAEILRLQRQKVDLLLKKATLKSDYVVQAREELSKANADVKSLSSVIKGRSDSLSRLTFRSPVKGIVKSVEVSTIGGVIAPGGALMEIVPLDDTLLIEARMSPRDIAFIHPDQRATVKITAYDYSVYGGLEGKVASISPDTIRDEVKPEVYYYRVFVKTESDALINKAGQRFPIVPGMVAVVDVHTGSKTVLEYLLKPINRAREALRER
ncbi:HlyD family type I secretion periplasmic adaptor subunit [Salmonella enterica subsp. enterica]|nr:HlyD family type I secretion periplasmic adaptor subunit [Salmonella enterica subsp. enterica serovar Enteritidis]